MSNYEGALSRLATRFGGDVAEAIADEHARWALYEQALDDRSLDATVVRALHDDPDSSLVSATVVRALELVPACERPAWFEVLPHKDLLEFAEVRAADLDSLQQLQTDPDADPVDIGSWTLWLQRRAAENAASPIVLGVLAIDGSTRRIRHDARERLRLLKRAQDS